MSYFVQVHKVAMQVIRIKDLWPNAHLHPQVELIYLEEGSCEAVVDNQRHTVNSGEMLVVFPNQVHAYFEQTPVKGYVVIFTPEIFPEFHEILQSKLPSNPVVQTQDLTLDVGQQLSNIKSKLKAKAALADTAAKGQLLAFIAEMFLHMNFIDKPGEASTMKSILNYCVDHYTEPFTLEEMAKALYLSKYYICHMFRQRLNTSFKDFVNQLRIEASCELLKKGTSITEAAYASGFSSVRTFNRVFSNYMRMSPREYVKKKRFWQTKEDTDVRL